MGYKVSISPKAHLDIANAYEYYAEKGSMQAIINLGKELDVAYKSLEKNPHFRIRYKNITGFPLKKFPFLLLYEIDDIEKKVYIYSVFNTYLNPKKYPGK
ncbi:hypothetical protein AM493_18210 [Flavobacterium akiainvivens]|uniref:Plasmid stabilization protein n=1 Tax=Flavobacterium akiainvivens TaxID=1202724 RepID=A0A0M9VJI0_9FLAO|nr:type II toxin-antitoxin system RelE/ParE family toxin [Flavobacterium akiainvivens]KOS07769.1 hypothetical protein AM493_18210 [Flavobacterium akiainvivens]SFQ25941.1 hypothetical protein SAMN05444144_102223 [Flavobacterium akiainvivens]